MGVLNVTPDSFSDGGLFFSVNRSIDHAARMIAEGADITVKDRVRKKLLILAAIGYATEQTIHVGKINQYFAAGFENATEFLEVEINVVKI